MRRFAQDRSEAVSLTIMETLILKILAVVRPYFWLRKRVLYILHLMRSWKPKFYFFQQLLLIEKLQFLGDLQTAKRLIANGADVNTKDNGNYAPLHISSQNGNIYLILMSTYVILHSCLKESSSNISKILDIK